MNKPKVCTTEGCRNYRIPTMTVCFDHADETTLHQPMRSILARLDKLESNAQG